METNQQQAKEQKTEEQKLAEVQKVLENRKRKNMRFLLTAIISVIIAVEVLVIFLRHDAVWYHIVYYTFFSAVFGLMIIPETIKMMNMDKQVLELKKKVELEDKMILIIKSEYRDICRFTLNKLPKEYLGTITYLWSKEGKTPEQVIDSRDEEFKKMVLELKGYALSPERNFWQYFISWKWLKKVPK